RNIRHRGRAYEQDIRPDYLESIQQAYFSFFRYSPELPILILEVEQVSFWHDEAAYGEILRQIGQTYEPGVHRKVIG
ncbi:MAG: deoxynucleoside kinase, partial [Saprospiraceae bacterium]|nr:deoxynucleoside kinase [Saprospiraceae bacterium]